MQETRQITGYRQALRGRILQTAMNLFAQRGVKAVKMDDIAASLTISKRTLYEIYENKELLLFEGIKKYYEESMARTKAYALGAVNVIDIVLYVYRAKAEEFQRTSPIFYDDIERYPRVVEYLEKQHQQTRQQFWDFMMRGVAEGYFRDDVNYELVSHLFEALGDYMHAKRLYQQWSFEELFHNLLFVSLRGICTAKGVAAIDDFLRHESERGLR